MDTFTPMIPKESAVFLPRFQTKAGEKSIDICRIVYLKVQINYTMFYLSDGEQVITTLSLSNYARLLEPHGFIRIHKSYLVNERYFVPK